MEAQLQQKWQSLLDYLRDAAAGGLAVALSGGVDSALLALAAREAGIEPLALVCFVTPLHSADDTAAAERAAQEMGLPLTLLSADTLALPQVAQNSRQRCYHCKKALFSELLTWAAQHNLAAVAEGSNSDDALTFRPGGQAAAELGVLRPLAEAGLNKAEIRRLAAQAGLSAAARPSTPCLASRFPYDTPLSPAALQAVAAGEELLRQRGFSELRLRAQGQWCRLELPPESWPQLLELREEIVPALRELGWTYIVVDMEGLRSGSYDR